jgi:hypothetical protein
MARLVVGVTTIGVNWATVFSNLVSHLRLILQQFLKLNALEESADAFG